MFGDVSVFVQSSRKERVSAALRGRKNTLFARTLNEAEYLITFPHLLYDSYFPVLVSNY